MSDASSRGTCVSEREDMNCGPRLVIEAANATTDQELAGCPWVGPSLARGRREGPSVNADKDTRPESADAAWMRARSDDSVSTAESPALRAQDPQPPEWGADSMVSDSSDSRMVSSSSDLEEEVADTLLRRSREQMESGPNPYLREIRDRAKPVWWASIALGAGSRAIRYPGAGVTYGPGSAGGTLTAEVGRRFNQHARHRARVCRLAR